MRRAFDTIIALLLLAVLSPLLLAAGLVVRLTSPGPALYRSERVGLGGRRFWMLKFRTMVQGADRMGPGITAQGDPRITPVGGFLRATKIDELPQLWNVVKGDLSLIGPRAESPQFVVRYTTQQRRLLSIRPGVTGPGQLHYTTDQETSVVDLDRAEEVYVRDLLSDKLARDLAYLDHRTLSADLRIIGLTIRVIAASLGRAIAGGRRREAAPAKDSREAPSPGKARS